MKYNNIAASFFSHFSFIIRLLMRAGLGYRYGEMELTTGVIILADAFFLRFT